MRARGGGGGGMNIICTFDMWIVHDTFVLYVETLVFPHLYYSDDRGGHGGGGDKGCCIFRKPN